MLATLDTVYGSQCVYNVLSLGCVGKWLGDCATRHGSSIEGGSGNDLVTLVSVEKFRGTDLDNGEIGATRWRQRVF